MCIFSNTCIYVYIYTYAPYEPIVSIYLRVHSFITGLAACLPVYPSNYLSIHLSMYLSIFVSVYFTTYLSISIHGALYPTYLSLYLSLAFQSSICLSTQPYIYLTTYVFIWLFILQSKSSNLCKYHSFHVSIYQSSQFHIHVFVIRLSPFIDGSIFICIYTYKYI